MKKIFIGILALIMVGGLVGCSRDETTERNKVMAALTKYYWIYDGGTTKYADDTVRTQDITLYQFFRDGFFTRIDSSKMTEAGYELRRREYKGTFDIHTRSDTITLTFNDGDKYRESIFTYAFHDDQLTVIEDTIGELTSVEIEE